MADHADQVYMNNATFSANIFSIKDEQCQEDSFIEDKVCISETTITPDDVDLGGSVWDGKIKQYEESRCLDNIKRELTLFEVTGIHKGIVAVEEGISAGDIKNEFSNGLLYCEQCEAFYQDYCIKCGMLVHILNKHALNNADCEPQEDIPSDILEIQDCLGQTGVYALRIIPAGVKFGPFTGLSATECPWEIKEEKFVLDKSKSKYLNWMQYVNPTGNTSERNLCVFQCEDNTYYESICTIKACEELLVYFGEEYRDSLNKTVEVDFVTTTKDIVKDVFACTFCCLGFSSKSHLVKHKTICVENTDGELLIEELTQCPCCKIHLVWKEYFEHHMAFCSERSVRKYNQPTPPANQATTVLNGPKRCFRQTYKCEQCMCRTKYRADLKQHTKQHCEVKMCKCGICNRRFKTRESLRLHVKNTHAYVGRKDEQEHSTHDYSKAHIKVEQSSSRDQNKIFKCSLCVFQTKYKQVLRTHVNTKHLKQFNFKCDFCEFRTNEKRYLNRHIKTKHLKQFDFKCNLCEYRTNTKGNLERHIKNKESLRLHVRNTHAYVGGKDEQEHSTHDYSKAHIKVEQSSSRGDQKKIFKCSLCLFQTKYKQVLRKHVNTKHLKQFDFKCDLCEFRTNEKRDLERHIKTKHLKEFDFKCDLCEYRTNTKGNLERHIKNKESLRLHVGNTHAYVGGKDEQEHSTHDYSKAHIKVEQSSSRDQRNIFKCSLCVLQTKYKQVLRRHVNTKHLKQFNFKCDLCEFRTNEKRDLERHIKSKHLKEFDFKCDLCEYRSNTKANLEIHLKIKHLKKLDYKCDKCGYGTNIKSLLKKHIKTKHLKKFDFNCDLCEFRTNEKRSLKRHIKTKHLKQFDFKCDLCEYRTNAKGNLEIHINIKHLRKFDYNCDKCEYGTKSKHRLEQHLTTKHLKQFDFKCEICEYRTNTKSNLERHIKIKHLKKID